MCQQVTKEQNARIVSVPFGDSFYLFVYAGRLIRCRASFSLGYSFFSLGVLFSDHEATMVEERILIISSSSDPQAKRHLSWFEGNTQPCEWTMCGAPGKPGGALRTSRPTMKCFRSGVLQGTVQRPFPTASLLFLSLPPFRRHVRNLTVGIAIHRHSF